jgi:hypothetical protein
VMRHEVTDSTMVWVVRGGAQSVKKEQS